MLSSADAKRIFDTYVSDVLSGKQVAGESLRLAAKRHVDDLEHGHERGLRFDWDAAYRAIFFLSCLKPSKWYRHMELLKWQIFATGSLFGWRREADQLRRFRRAYIEVARKNGKSAWLSGLGDYFLIADKEPGAEIYVANLDRDSARRIFDESVEMRDASRWLSKKIAKRGKNPCNALVVAGGGSYKPLSRDKDSMVHLNPSVALVDEIHLHKDHAVWDLLRNGMRTRRQPMLIGITFAGDAGNHEGLCWRLHDYGIQVLEGREHDDEFFPLIYNLDPGDSYEDEQVWEKANPVLGVLITRETVRKELREKIAQPQALTRWRRECLNEWIDGADDPAVEIAEWDACLRVAAASRPDLRQLREESEKALEGQDCFAGLDSASTNDTNALVLVFPPNKVDSRVRILEYFWIPKARMKERISEDHLPYDVWEQAGFIMTTPGRTIKHADVAKKIAELSQKFNIRQLAYDPTFGQTAIQRIKEEGFTGDTVDVRNTYAELNAPCIELTRFVDDRQLAHDGNPVMRRMVADLRWKYNAGGQRIPDKQESRDKIDGVSALVMALHRYYAPENQKEDSQFFVSG